MNPHAVALRGVSKRYGRHLAVDALDLEIASGSVFGLIGPNGSGKSTTIRMVLGILEPDAGSVSVLGETGHRAANDRIGYLPEERGLYRKMTVRRVLLYYAGLKGVDGATARRRSDVWLERMGLAEWASRKVEALSKGMQQKIQFIATVLSEPDLVILDEPFSGLDPVNLEVLRDAMLGLRHQGCTVIFSTHDMTKAEEMCDALAMIHRGRKVLDGPLSAIRREHGGDAVRVRAPGAGDLIASYRGVQGVRDLGQHFEVQLDGDPSAFLSWLAPLTPVTHFELAHRSLHDIFVQIAGPAAEANDAR